MEELSEVTKVAPCETMKDIEKIIIIQPNSKVRCGKSDNSGTGKMDVELRATNILSRC